MFEWMDEDERIARSIHDEEVNAARERARLAADTENDEDERA